MEYMVKKKSATRSAVVGDGAHVLKWVHFGSVVAYRNGERY